MNPKLRSFLVPLHVAVAGLLSCDAAKAAPTDTQSTVQVAMERLQAAKSDAATTAKIETPLLLAPATGRSDIGQVSGHKSHSSHRSHASHRSHSSSR
jgi:hypothetical protein